MSDDPICQMTICQVTLPTPLWPHKQKWKQKKHKPVALSVDVDPTAFCCKEMLQNNYKVFDPIVGHLTFNHHRTATRFNTDTISSGMNFHYLSK